MMRVKTDSIIPNFFLVGAPRSATTSLWTYLSEHPEIYMSYQKEPLFFGSDLTKTPSEFCVLDKKEYLDLFKFGANKPIRGEASVLYLTSKTAAREIYEFNPNSRILIALRNPVDLIYSSYGHLRWGGYEDLRDFDEALGAEEDRRKGYRVPKSCLTPETLFYREIGLLGQQVERYVNVFPREQIKFIVFDDLVRDPAAIYFDLLDFLGVRRVVRKSYKVRNSHKEARSLALSAWFQQPPPAARVVLDLIPQPHRYALLGHLQGLINTRKVDRPAMRPETRRMLQAHFAEDVKKLGKIVGRDFSGWLQVGDKLGMSKVSEGCEKHPLAIASSPTGT